MRVNRTFMGCGLAGICIFSDPGQPLLLPAPHPHPRNKTRNPQIIPTKKPQNLNPSLRLVAPADRLVPTRPSRSIVSSLSVWSCELVSLGARSGRRSRWSPFLRLVVLPGLAVSLGLSVSSRRSPSSPISLALSGLDSDPYWESEDFQARSRQATQNRNTEVEGPGTGPRSTVADSSETPPSVNDLYLHLHTVNHDRTTFIDTRSERFYDRLQSDVRSRPRATPEQSVDDEAVYLNVAGECSKGRVYGLGSVGRKKRRYGTPGASTSRDAGCGAAGESSMSLRSNYERTPCLGGRRGGYSGGGELGGGYGGFGASGLGAYRVPSLNPSLIETDNFRLYSVSNQKRNPYSVSDRISDDVFRDGTSPSLFRF
ncbi:hypothetical protein Sjap_018598 [Stephania japonica]|uniref:Uncharacterized protein n=1 Tax=Stephania japonica TaxID=461633 RepID=A0AAP0I8I0_9MAGN